jgi:F-type H+-transporting ATPase subunit delta
MAESELATVARPYARAAFSTALDEAEGLGAWSRMLGLLGAAVSDPVIELSQWRTFKPISPCQT